MQSDFRFLFCFNDLHFCHNKSFKPAKRSCHIKDLWSCALSQSKMCIVDDDRPPFARECHSRLEASQQKFQKTDVAKCRWHRRRKEKLMPKIGNSTAAGLRNVWTSKLLRESSYVCSAMFAKDYNLPKALHHGACQSVSGEWQLLNRCFKINKQ